MNARTLQTAGHHVQRYGLVLFLVGLGLFKFTEVEAEAIRPLVAHSPLLGWLYHLGSVGTVSALIGVSEIAIGLLIAARPVSATASAAGSLLAIGMFLTTLSFLFSTPGAWVFVHGFPVPSETGGFIVKDVFLLGAALATAGEALGDSSRTHAVAARGQFSTEGAS
jgi:uncharacterized membrane protein YkgB